ncbi:MAG: hypothetical protein ACYDEN_06385 [Acidimicrobiales bacterium]
MAGVRRSIDDHLDDHPAGDGERLPPSWALGLTKARLCSDDCEACGDSRVVLTLEEAPRAGCAIPRMVHQ